MRDISGESVVKSLPVTGRPGPERPQADRGNFGSVLSGALNQVERDNNIADRSIEALALNKGQEIHRTMIEMEKAEISFKLLMQVRNKIVSAYETIMRMPV